jgi:ArsR family transcriptional regulator
MSARTERLERFLGECCEASADERLEALDELQRGLDSPCRERELEVLSALANETRYRLVRALVGADDGLCVCELNAIVDVSESAISHAMSSLVDANLVTSHKEGRWKHYAATNRAVAIVTVLEGGVSDE